MGPQCLLNRQLNAGFHRSVQTCIFCWHKIRNEGDKRCPSCREPYGATPHEFVKPPAEETDKLKQKQKDKHEVGGPESR